MSVKPTFNMVFVYEANNDKSCKTHSSSQTLSSVSFSDLKLNLGLIQLGELLVVVTICQIFCSGPNVLAFEVSMYVFFLFQFQFVS